MAVVAITRDEHTAAELRQEVAKGSVLLFSRTSPAPIRAGS